MLSKCLFKHDYEITGFIESTGNSISHTEFRSLVERACQSLQEELNNNKTTATATITATTAMNFIGIFV